MSKSKADVWAEVHERAMERWARVAGAQWEERQQCLSDRRFATIPGAQWEDGLGEQFENQPRFEINKILGAAVRIFNEYRANRITVDYRAANPKPGSDDLADSLDGLYRADEQDSSAQEAYDTAFDEAVLGGMGAWRLVAEYEDNGDIDNDYQRIRIEPVPDADTRVFFDLDARKQDKRDATYAFLLTPKEREGYIDEYGDDPASWPQMEFAQAGFDWSTPDVVYVAEYWEIETERETWHYFRPIQGEVVRVSDDELEERQPDLEARGYRLERTRKVESPRVRKWLLSGGGVLEDCGYIAGEAIPLVLAYGKRWTVEGIERCMGHVRLAKDVQRLKNMQVSRLGEIAALSPVEKPIFTPAQMQGHTQMWADDSVARFSYMLVNPLTNPDGTVVPAGPIAYTKAPSIPPAMAALLQLTEQDMQDLLGNPQDGDQLRSNIGERTMEMLQQRLDMQGFIYMDNMAKAMKRCGEIWLGMARELYADEGRTLETLSEHGETGSLVVGQEEWDDQGNVVRRLNDIGSARMKVVVDVGPSFTTRRQSTVRTLTGLLPLAADGTDKQILTATIIANTEGEGLQDLKDYYRQKLLRAGAIKPTDEEREQLQREASQQAPDPEAQLATALAQESEAKAGKAKADTLLNLAKTEQAKAETVKTLAEVQDGRVERVATAVQTLAGAAPQPGAPLN